MPRQNRRRTAAAPHPPPDAPPHAPLEHTTGGASAVGLRRDLTGRPTVRVGVYAWALLGILGAVVAGFFALSQVTVVVIPLVLALFPAAVLVPATDWLKRRIPDALAALLVLVGSLALLSGIVAALAPSVAEELSGVTELAQEGAQQAQDFLEGGPLGLPPVPVGELSGRIGELLQNTEGLASNVLGAAAAVLQGLTSSVLLLVALFFYLKDGPRIARFLRSLFPEQVQPDIDEIGMRVWGTVGAYIRGQLFIALVDAVFIGIALSVLGVPLVLPLAVLVFFGGLFPIVGAFVSGSVAVLVALAANDLRTALFVLIAILVVQQVEGNLLAPIVLGRATQLHPLATIVALAAGGVLLGVLGAFIAVPVVASAARTVGYLRHRIPG